MPRQTPQADSVRAQASPRKRSRKPGPPAGPARREAQAAPAARPHGESAAPGIDAARAVEIEAQRALLADPASIACATPAAKRARRAPARRAPVREAPSSTARAPEASRSIPLLDPPAPASAAARPKPHVRPAIRQLLDVTRARRAARDSLLCMRAPASASPAASESRTAQPLPLAVPTEPARRPARPEAPGWQRRPLADPRPDANPAPRPAEPTHAAAAGSPPDGPAQAISAAERRLAAELREARATLAIARETTLTQREEIARLRAERAAALAPVVLEAATPPPSVSSADVHAERLRLRERIAALEAELERALLERAQLHQAMAAQQQEAVERNRSQAALQERFELLERELDEMRRRAEDEHHRHAEAQALLANLRSTLRCADPAAARSPETPGDGATVCTPFPAADALPQPPPALPMAQALASGGAGDPESASAVGAAPTPAPSTPILPLTKPTIAAASAPIFSFWLEGQIRRSFGPLGIDSLPDLVREPLARRARSAAGPVAILLAGRGVAAESRAFAESLLRSGSPEFVLYVADPDGAVPRFDRGEDPLRGRIRDRALPDRPQVLQACLNELEPAVVVTRELLTWQADVAPWLDVLRGASEGGAALVLLEQTGLGRVIPDDAFAAIGERIWELLPERYARDPETGRRLERFRDAFAARPTPPRNALLQQLRAGFELELFARFGFLAEAFVRGPIAGHFDPKQARDRRFIDQIADVDERRLESGSGSPLYLVARIDPAEAR